MGRATDVEDLEKMLNDGEGDEDLSNCAIEIFERLRDEVRRVKFSSDAFHKKRLEGEIRDFMHVIEAIERRRHKRVLDKFKEYVQRQPD